jgi:hypothetical protein
MGRRGEQFIAVNGRWRLQRIEYQPCELSACFLGRNSALICPVRAFECWSLNEPARASRKIPQ